MSDINSIHSNEVTETKYDNYIRLFLDELHFKTTINKFTPEHTAQLEKILKKLISPNFMNVLVVQMKAILEDGKITSADIPSIMIIIANLLNEQLPMMQTTIYTRDDLREIILIVMNCMVDQLNGISELRLSEMDKQMLNSLVNVWFNVLLIKLLGTNGQNGWLSSIWNKMKNTMCCQSCTKKSH